MNKEEALELISSGKISEWNSRREQLKELDLSGSNFSGLDLESANFFGVNLSNASFRDAKLKLTNFSSAILTHADFTGALLEGTVFEKANCTKACFSRPDNEPKDFHRSPDKETGSRRGVVCARLLHTNFKLAVLDDAEFQGCQFNKCEIKSTSFQSAGLRNCVLSNLDLTESNFNGATLKQSDLSGSDLSNCRFVETNLQQSNLSRSKLSFACFEESNLEFADLSNANCRFGRFTRTTIHGAKLDGAKIVNVEPILFDSNSFAGVETQPYAKHPWFVLRRAYTGPMFAFLILFTVIAFLPVVAKTFFYVGVAEAEKKTFPIAISALDKVNSILGSVTLDLPDQVKDWLSRSREFVADRESFIANYQADPDLLSRLIYLMVEAPETVGRLKLRSESERDLLHNALQDISRAKDWLPKPTGTHRYERWYVWQLVLGVNNGWATCAFLVLVLIYNFGRAILTYYVGPLRYEEEQTQVTPSLSSYHWMITVHRINSILLWVALGSGSIQLYQALTTVVILPMN